MFRKVKLIGQLLLLQLTAKSQSVPFDQLPFSNSLNTEIDSVLHEQVKTFFSKSKAPGIIIGVSRNSEKKYYSYGFADPITKKSFSSHTIFEAGSITKTFTANVLMQMDGAGLVSLSGSLNEYLPVSVGNDSVLSRIILQDILTHTSGLPRLPDDLDKIKEYALMQPYAFYGRNYLYPYLQKLKKITAGKYAYSNLGYGLLGTLMEDKSQLSYESLLKQYILDPLSMNDSYVETKRTMNDTATGFFTGRPAAYWKFDCLAGAGALKSTAEDMLKYLDAHISLTNDTFSKTVGRMTKPVWPAGPGMQICYGWHTLDNMKHRVYWHNGGTYGFSTFAAFEPATKTSIVFAANSFNVNQPLEKLAMDLLIYLMGK